MQNRPKVNMCPVSVAEFVGGQQQDTHGVRVCHYCCLEGFLNTLKVRKKTPHDMQTRLEMKICPVFVAGFVGRQQQNTHGGVCHYC